MESIKAQINEMGMREICIGKFMDKVKEYIEMPKLISELLRVFILRIEVYEKLEKYSHTCGNPLLFTMHSNCPNKTECLR